MEETLEMPQDVFEDDDTLVRGDVKVSWVELGESLFGEDYNEDDPEDVEVLRFDVHLRGALIELHNQSDDMADEEWANAGAASYATQFPVTATPEQRRAGLLVLMNRVYDLAVKGYPVKKTCEELSWIDLGWLKS